jgi:putative peptidoglycan lipid II flippase
MKKITPAKSCGILFPKLFFTFCLILFALVAFTMLASPLLVRVMAPGFHDVPGKLELATFLNQIMAPYLFFIGLSAFLMGILNIHDHFLMPAFNPILLNLSIIVMAVFVSPHFSEPALAVAIGVLIGGTLQFLCQVPAVMKRGMHFKFGISFNHPAIRQIGALLIPSLFGIGIVQLNLLVDSFIASFLKEGSVSSLYYASRLTELILGVDAVSVATVILPSLSKAAHEGQLSKVKELVSFGLRQMALVTIPAAVGLMVLARPIVKVLFEHGKFTAADTERTAFCLFFFSIGLFFVSAVKILAPAFYAFFDTKTPVKAAFASLAANIIFNLLFMHSLGVGGIALATALAAVVNIAMLSVAFSKKHGAMDWKGIGQSLSKMAIASLGMALVCGVILLCVRFDQLEHKVIQAAVLAGLLMVGSATYFLLSWLLKVPELSDFLSHLKKRKPLENPSVS